MKNRIDLSKYDIRTDLLIESVNSDNKDIIVDKVNDSVKITTINVNSLLANDLDRKIGTYITIEYEDITNYEDRVVVTDCLSLQIKVVYWKRIKK